MNNLIKHIVEAFDFNSINNQKKVVNVYDRFYKIIETPYNKLTQEDKEYIKCIKNFIPAVYKINNKKELKTIISRAIKIFGNKCNLSWIDVSNINDMSELFFFSDFNGDISKWNVSNVTDMSKMFYKSKFNGDISKWDVSSVRNMSFMFSHSQFNGDISQWDVSNIKDMSYMFIDTEFNHDISNWNINNVTDKFYMFNKCPIKQEYKPKIFNKKNKISESFDFDTVDKSKNRINARPQIQQDTLNKFLADERLTDEEKIVINNLPDRYYAIDDETELKNFIDKCVEVFGKKCNLNWIDISGIDDMSRMFMYSSFNGDISRWDVAHVIKMNYMFYNSEFNGDISSWNVEQVEDMHGMFELSVFNQPIPNWTFRYIKTTRDMFKRSQFNQDISKWKLRYTTFTKNMFLGCPIKKEYKPDLSNTNKQY